MFFLLTFIEQIEIYCISLMNIFNPFLFSIAIIEFEKDLVPTSCCNTDDGYTFDQCQRENSDSTQPPQVNTTVGVGAENPALYSVVS